MTLKICIFGHVQGSTRRNIPIFRKCYGRSLFIFYFFVQAGLAYRRQTEQMATSKSCAKWQ